jgi:hypothetical protein
MRHHIQLPYGLLRAILRVFNTVLYENEFQNPQKFPTISSSRAINFSFTHQRVLKHHNFKTKVDT